jgi:membrane-associated phospholipid phosphatase
MKVQVIVILCLLAGAASSARAQESELLTQYESCFENGRSDTIALSETGRSPFPAPAWHAMITNIPGDWLRSGKLLVRGESLPVLAGVAIATGALFVTDNETHRASFNLYDRSPAIRSGSDVLIHIGDGKTAFGMAAAFALYGFAAGDNRALSTGSQTVEAVLASGIVVQLLKRVSGRESPEMASIHRGRWRPFPNWETYNHHQPKYYAFPSGHITTTMAMVTVIAENYPEVGWIRPVGYTVVGLVGISLVNVGWHWYSDFPLGIALGYSFGMIVSHRGDPVSGEEDLAGGKGMRVMPTITPEGTGVAVSWNF